MLDVINYDQKWTGENSWMDIVMQLSDLNCSFHFLELHIHLKLYSEVFEFPSVIQIIHCIRQSLTYMDTDTNVWNI